jgi:hypothetical protein
LDLESVLGIYSVAGSIPGDLFPGVVFFGLTLPSSLLLVWKPSLLTSEVIGVVAVVAVTTLNTECTNVGALLSGVDGLERRGPRYRQDRQP